MRTLGLLGGMSWESSLEYYRLINTGVREALGGSHSARLVLHSVDFADIAELQHAGRWDEAGRVLHHAAAGLRDAGAEGIVICTNTMHLVADVVMDGLGLPLIDVIEVTGSAVRQHGLSCVALLGTAFTMEHGFYAAGLQRHGLDVLTPPAEQRAVVHQIIFDELVRGILTDSSRRYYLDVMAELARRGAEAIIFGCTEIGLLVPPHDAPLPAFDTTRLHAAAAVDWALS